MSWQFSAPTGTEVVRLDEAGADGCLVVKLRSTRPTDPACPHCGGPRIKNGTRIVRFRDIPTAGGQAVVIDWLQAKVPSVPSATDRPTTSTPHSIDDAI